VAEASSVVQRMQKVLTEMNVQLSNVLSDISGVSGMKIIQAIGQFLFRIWYLCASLTNVLRIDRSRFLHVLYTVPGSAPVSVHIFIRLLFASIRYLPPQQTRTQISVLGLFSEFGAKVGFARRQYSSFVPFVKP
jgi:hypothetical protein